MRFALLILLIWLPVTQKYSNEAKHIISKVWIIERLVNYGFEKPAIDSALKIIYRESRYIEDAINVNVNGSIDKGLFQINSIHNTHSKYNLLLAEDNIEVFSILHKQYGWKPWIKRY